ncbi:MULTISPECIES: hypothetical protein [unclassified Nonomuraea]|uniref:hypothetical protein n=1 Tax=unclassified Nonomuraea TaxID=2593643 RepID=UPI003403CEFB
MWPLPDDRPSLYLLDQPSPPFPPQLNCMPLSGRARELAGGWWHLPETESPTPMCRPAQRAARRLQQLLGYLWETSPPSPGDALCQQDIRPGFGGITAYSGIRLGRSRHHVFVAGCQLPTARVRDVREVTIITGTCLFSGPSARVITGSGGAVPIADLRHSTLPDRAIRLEVEEQLTLAEHEATARLASAASGLASRIPPTVDVTVLADVPNTATALHLLESAQRGQVSPALLLDWCDAVAARHDRVSALLTARCHAVLAEVGSSQWIRIARPDELEQVGAYLRCALTRGRVPTTLELVSVAASQDPLWQRTVRIARPATPSDLAALSYVVPQIRAALSTRDQPRLAIQVESPQELKILLRSRSLTTALLAHSPDAVIPLAGIYPLGRLWVRGCEGGTHPALYCHDPGRWAVDASGQRIDLVELAVDLYPAAAQRVAVGG